MSRKRLLISANGFIAFLLMAALGLVYWFAWRPLPQRSGSIKAPLTGAATVTWDAIGVPHIRAASINDALFLQGYVTAQDRLWQMDAIRRIGAGEFAEVIGPPALESDREARRLRMRRAAEEHARNLSTADRAVFAAYARGVNYFIETHRGRLPLEFTLLEYEPRPWSLSDSMLVGMQMFRELTTTWREEILKRNLIAGGDPAKVNFLFPIRTGPDVQIGSNAWVLSGKHTASGKPILANDPHLEWNFPSTWYMVHLEAPGLNVSGVALPGLPCVVIGHNERIAWGLTNLHFDVQDLYEEQFDPQTGRYIYEGKPEQARPDRDLIPVKGENPVEMITWVTRHGPVIVMEGQKHFALRWIAAEKGGIEFPFLEVNRASNWQEFTTALARFPGPAQNFLYADVDGNIGHQVAGRLPIRPKHRGDQPADGKGGFEWGEFIPFDQLPSAFNPPSGRIVSANQNPFPRNYAYPVHGNFGPHFRSRQIDSLLSSKTPWRPEEMIGIQTDVYSAFSHFLAKHVITAVERRKPTNPDLPEPVRILREWDGQMTRGAAPFLITLVFQHVRRGIAECASPGKGLTYEIQMAPAVIQQLLSDRPAGWFKDYDEFLVRSFSEAVEEGKRLQGSDPRRWDYGQYTQMQFTHPVFRQLPLVASYFMIGPVPMAGAPTTVKQTSRRVGPSMRFIADLSDWDNSLQNITFGQSTHPLSPHFKDQWDAYYGGRSFPMQFHNIEGKSTLSVEPGR